MNANVLTTDKIRKIYVTFLLTLERLEDERKSILRKFFFAAGAIASLTLLIIGGVAARHPETGMEAYLIIGVIGLIAVIVSWFIITTPYVIKFKQQIIGPLVKTVDAGLNYNPKGHISLQEFQQSRIFLNQVDRFAGEDLVSGTLGQTSIRFSEIHAEYKTESRDSDGNSQTNWHTIFKGVFLIADFNKHFRNLTLVLPDTAEKLFGWVGEKLQAMNVTRPELVKLEDPEFENHFVVYSENRVEARYILSPSLMRRLVDYRKKTRKNLSISFVNDHIMMAIPYSHNLFEPNILKSNLAFETIKKFLEDIHLFAGVVEDLNLNTRIWSKE